MIQLTDEEFIALRSQFATLQLGRGQHRKYLPHVFTEHGAIMAATILNSQCSPDRSDHHTLIEAEADDAQIDNKSNRWYILQHEGRCAKSPPRFHHG